MSNKVKVMQHFSVPIYSRMLEGFEERQESIIEMILSKRDESPGIQRSNLNMWHSENDLHLWKHDNITWFNSKIGEFARACVTHIDKSYSNHDIIMSSAWANVGGYGAWHAPHNHFPSQWSGVFYVLVEHCIDWKDKKSKNGKIEFLNPSPLAHSYGQPNGVTYNPKDGLVLLFPAVLEHLVHPNMSENQRIAISFNLNLFPRKG